MKKILILIFLSVNFIAISKEYNKAPHEKTQEKKIQYELNEQEYREYQEMLKEREQQKEQEEQTPKLNEQEYREYQEMLKEREKKEKSWETWEKIICTTILSFFFFVLIGFVFVSF